MPLASFPFAISTNKRGNSVHDPSKTINRKPNPHDLWVFIAGWCYASQANRDKLSSMLPNGIKPPDMIVNMFDAIEREDINAFMAELGMDVEIGDNRTAIQVIIDFVIDRERHEVCKQISERLSFTQLQSPSQYAEALEAAMQRLKELGVNGE